ncbi:Crp/Fnr family transcriptional regulator [Segetibacter sp. 3557_3]|uniref:Crp/Fnr family transcriptional regulator n=1 Tax=Segetibacter sp. 3557_3 TaxID=2547429 RepID=UPI0014044BDF|nr:Crp/Fnr family transcriptional regulator [Segetibacter sp. 3557_3]
MSEKLIEDIQHYASLRTYKKDQMILKEGVVANYTSWILKGAVRSYYLKDGEEITTKFLQEGSHITSIYSYYSRRPGIENVIALEDVTLACFHYDQMQLMYKTYPEFNVIGRIVTEKYLYFLEIELFNLRKTKAEERYRFFVKHFPQLLQRAPLKHIATYLGMNLETLSRIRSNKK